MEFSNKKKSYLAILLVVMTIFSVGLVIVRVMVSGHYTYVFFVWNLFLAIIPYGISLLVTSRERLFRNFLISGVLLSIWLLFLPNAFYIMTDLFHLKPRHNIPLWFDLMIIFSSAWTGLLFGYMSLIDVHFRIEKVTNASLAWVFSTTTLVLCSFGVYLGRYLRWNSWDLLSNPTLLIYDIFDIVFHPITNLKPWGFTFTYSLFFLLGFITFKVLISEPKISNDQLSGTGKGAAFS